MEKEGNQLSSHKSPYAISSIVVNILKGRSINERDTQYQVSDQDFKYDTQIGRGSLSQSSSNFPLYGNLQTHPIFDQYGDSINQENIARMRQRNTELPPVKNSLKNLENSEFNFNDMNTNGEGAEQTLENIRRNESQLLMNMSHLDVNSQLYQIKKGQYMQTQSIQTSLQQKIIEKKISRAIQMKGGPTRFPSINQNNSIASQSMTSFDDSNALLKQLEMPNGRGYSWDQGFVIRWDLISGLSESIEKLKLNYGIFLRRQSMVTYRMSEVFETEKESKNSKQCLILDQEIIQGIHTHPDSVIYIELFDMKKTDDFSEEFQSEIVGWTLFEIFKQGKINQGMFKLPFYSQKYTVSLLYSQGLPFLGNTFLNIRCSLPFDPYFDQDTDVIFNIEYDIPMIHMKGKSHMAANQHTPTLDISDITNLRLGTMNKINLNQTNGSFNKTASGIDTPFKKSMGFETQNKSGIEINLGQTPMKRNFDALSNQNEIQTFGSSRSIGAPTVAKKISPNLSTQYKPDSQNNIGVKFHIQKLVHFDESIYGRTMDLEVHAVRYDSIMFGLDGKDVHISQGIGGIKSDELNTIEFQNTNLQIPINIARIITESTPDQLQTEFFLLFCLKHRIDKDVIAWKTANFFQNEAGLLQLNIGVFREYMNSAPYPELPIDGRKTKFSPVIVEYILEDGSTPEDSLKFYDLAKDQVSLRSVSGKDQKDEEVKNFNDNGKALTIQLLSISDYFGKPEIFLELSVVHKSKGVIFDSDGQKCTVETLLNVTGQLDKLKTFQHKKAFAINETFINKEYKKVERDSLEIKFTIKSGTAKELVGYTIIKLMKLNHINIEVTDKGQREEILYKEDKGQEKKTKHNIRFKISIDEDIRAGLKEGKVYDVMSGVFINLKSITSFKEKYGVIFSINFIKTSNSQVLMDNQNSKAEFVSTDSNEPDQQKKQIIINDTIEMGMDPQRIQDLNIQDLSGIFVLISFINPNNQEIYGWIAHPMFRPNNDFNEGTLPIDIFQPPYPDKYPFDEKKQKQTFAQFDGTFGQARLDDDQLGGAINETGQQKKHYDPNEGVGIDLKAVTGFKEQWGMTWELRLIEGKPSQVINDNDHDPIVYPSSATLMPDTTIQIIKISEQIEIPLNPDQIQDEKKDHLKSIYFLIQFFQNDKNKVEDFGWACAPLFIGQGLNIKDFVVDIYQFPLPDIFPYDQKTVKKTFTKFQFSLNKARLDDSVLFDGGPLTGLIGQQAPPSNAVAPLGVVDQNSMPQYLHIDITGLEGLKDDIKFNLYVELVDMNGNMQDDRGNEIGFISEEIFESKAKQWAGSFDVGFQIDFTQYIQKINYQEDFKNQILEIMVNMIQEDSQILFGWYYCQLISQTGQLISGQKNEYLFLPPPQVFPNINVEKLKKHTAKIQFECKALSTPPID